MRARPSTACSLWMGRSRVHVKPLFASRRCSVAVRLRLPVCIGDSARTRSPPIETSNKTASSITSLILSCRIIGTVWLENWLPHVLCIGCVPRRELMKTTNFSSGTNRDAIAGLLPSARVRCQRFARWQCKSSGTRNLAYFVTAGEAVTLLLPSRQGCSGLVITCPTNSTRALVTSAPG